MPYDISVIIPAINEQSSVGRAIRSAWAAGAAEVILADGGSQDDTRRIAQQQDCRIIDSAPGRARQQNAGAAMARGRILLFQHADCQLGADCLRQIADHLDAHPTTAFGAFHQRLDAVEQRYRVLEWGNAMRVRWLGLAYGDQGIFVTRDAFDRVGRFADIPLMEDVQLVRQLHRLGPPVLLPGPLHVSVRRWQKHGIVRQTARNWCLLTAFLCGVPPAALRRFYSRHDRTRRRS